MPVLDTAKTNSPSREASRATTAFQRGSSPAFGEGCIFMLGFVLNCERIIASKASVSSMALVVIVGKAYVDRPLADYPNLASKPKLLRRANKGRCLRLLRISTEWIRFSLNIFYSHLEDQR